VFQWLKTIVVLPANVLIFIPAGILYCSGWRWERNSPLLLALGGALLVCGLWLAGWTMRLFHRVGRGTAAPWNPPRNLVIAGPYRHVRNPMLTGVFIMQIAESLLLNSWELAVFFAVFLACNMLYFPLVEEKGLERRFGGAYPEYKRNVPRWLPRLTPYRPDEEKPSHTPSE
jgi:protein-S-isoprenylcysteine O-methyltransferase Ste14